MSNDREEQTNSSLEGAIRAIGPDPITGNNEQNGNLPKSLYDFVRRYDPTLCVDVALIPSNNYPSVILARRGFNAVAPGQEWIFGGRVNKELDYVNVGESKVEKEIGLKVKLSPTDILGIGATRFPIDPKEETPRDYTVSTGNLVFAKKVPYIEGISDKIHPADGHLGEWRVADKLDITIHPYILNVVAAAWERFYGSVWKDHVSAEALDIIGDPRDFMPLRYSPLKK